MIFCRHLADCVPGQNKLCRQLVISLEASRFDLSTAQKMARIKLVARQRIRDPAAIQDEYENRQHPIHQPWTDLLAWTKPRKYSWALLVGPGSENSAAVNCDVLRHAQGRKHCRNIPRFVLQVSILNQHKVAGSLANAALDGGTFAAVLLIDQAYARHSRNNFTRPVARSVVHDHYFLIKADRFCIDADKLFQKRSDKCFLVISRNDN